MINKEALNYISYGLYIVSSGNKEKANGYIANTVFQITSEPAKFAISCNKNNYTSELIREYKSFSVSILKQETKSDTIGNFGFKSGKNFNKSEGFDIKYGKTGTPIFTNDSIAYLEFKLTDVIDINSHFLFIGELVDTQMIGKSETPLTYAYYKNVKKGIAPKNAPTYIKKENAKNKNTKLKIYKCSICGHIYDNNIEKIKFEELPDDWKCPTCGVSKEEFSEIQ